jgi:flagella synthesis protein FlgN
LDSQAKKSELLDHQIQQLVALQQLLKDELTALKHRDIEQITEIARQKSSLLNRLQEADHQLTPLLTENDNINDDASRQQIEQMLETCKQLNEINGQTLKMSMAGLARLQNMLASVRNETSGTTYDQSGQTRSGGKLGNGIKV